MLDDSDDEIQIVETHNPKLLVEDGQPLKIYFDGFPVRDTLKLMEMVKKYGGETSTYADAGILILSLPKFPATGEFDRFHVEWLFGTIKFNKIQNLPNYKLNEADPAVKVEIINEDNEDVVESTSPEFETRASYSSNIDNVIECVASSTDEYSFVEARMRSKRRASSSGKVTSKRIRLYTYEEEKAMIQYLIEKKAIARAGGGKIWKEMLEDNLIQNRTAVSIAAHFRNFLRWKIPEFVTDPEIIEKFQQREDEQQRKSRRRKLNL